MEGNSEQKLRTVEIVDDDLEKVNSLQTPPHSLSRKRKSIDPPNANDISSKKLKEDCNDLKQTLINEKTSLQKTQGQKQETLRQLRLVKLYRSKNNLPQLQKLIDKWREACQQSLIELQERMPEPKPTINDLIQLWQLDQELLQYKSDEESF